MKFSYLYGAYGTPVRYNVDAYKDKTRVVIATLICAVLLFSIAALQIMHAKNNVVEASPVVQQPQQPNENLPKPSEPSPTTVNYQSIVDDWTKSHKGTYGIVVSSLDGKTIASSGADQKFFMASIYKLYTAYIAYQKVDKGTLKLSDPYWKDWTRGQCLDAMIRISHNECGEKMLPELGREVSAKLKSYGLQNTSIGSFETTAGDAAIILARIQNGTDLSVSSRDKLLDSMLGQKYRDGLPQGFSSSSVYDKVGFRSPTEYHDVGIVKLSNGSSIIVSIMTKDAGVNNIAGLAKQISSALK